MSLLYSTTSRLKCCRTALNLQIASKNYSARHIRTLPVELSSEKHTPTESSSETPLVIIHGLFGSKQNWRTLGHSFTKKLNREVHCLDMRNHGDSPHSPDCSYQAMAMDVAEYLQDEHLDSVILLGHSMGGKVAMTLALSNEDLVEKLISVDIGPNVGRIGEESYKYIKAMQDIDETGPKRKADADLLLQKYEDNAAIRQFLLTNYVYRTKLPHTNPNAHREETYAFRISLKYLAKEIGNLGDFPFSQDATVTYNKPTLFIRGGLSKYMNPQVVKKAKDFFPNMKLETIEDAGHWVHAEKPKEFTKILSEFLD